MAKSSFKDQVGLFISVNRIEAVHLTGDAEDPVLSASHAVELPEGILADDGSIEDPAALSRELKAFWVEAGFRTRRVVLVLDTRKALVRQARLPNIPLGSLQQAILSEAEQFAIFRKDEPLVDYFVTEPSENHISICYGALAKDLADSYSKALQRAGLKLVGVDLLQLAGLRAMDFFHRLEGQTWTSIMVHHHRLIVSYWHESKLRVMREVILPERSTLDLDLIAQTYLTEIVRSNAQDTGVEDRTPTLAIGCDSLDDAFSLADRANALLGAETKVAGDATWFVEDDPEEDPLPEALEASYVAIGAALWGRAGEFPSFNFIGKRPSPGLAAPRANALSPAIERVLERVKPHAPSIAASLLLMIGLSSWQVWAKAATDAEVSALKRQLGGIEIEIEDAKSKMSATPPDAELLRQWIPYQRENAFAVRLLGTLREITPSDTWLTKLTYTAGKTIDLSGSSMSQTSCLYLADEISALENVEQVRIVKLEKSGAVFSFVIQGGIRSDWETPQ